MIKSPLADVYFIPVFYSFPEEKVDRILEKLDEIINTYFKNFNFVEIYTITPYLELVKKIKERYKDKIKVYEILGCMINKPKNNKVIFLGDGYFHPVEIFRKYKVEVYQLNPFNLILRVIKDKNFFNKLEKLKELFHKSKYIGIFTSIKPGQRNIDLAEKIKRILEEKYNKKVFLFIGDKFGEDVILNFYKIDVWIDLACPRIMDDFENVISFEFFIKYVLNQSI